MEYRSPVCRARICRKSPLIFQHPSFILARRNNRHHFRVSSRMMPMPPGYTKVFGFAPTWCTKVQPYGKRRAVFLLQFPGMRRTGAPSGTRTGRVGRFAYRPTTKPQWGFVSPRESPRWCTTNALQKAARRFFATFKEGRRFCAFFLGIRDIGMMAVSARPLQINRKRHFGGDFRLGGEPRPTC